MVELMVSLVLGLVVVGAVLNVYLSARQAFRIQESLARLQESGRFALEMMTREIREAGRTPCGSPLTANVLVSKTPGATPWWADTAAGLLRGGENDAQGIVQPGVSAANQAIDTDTLLILRPSNDEHFLATVLAHDAAAMTVDVQVPAVLKSRDIFLMCDSGSSALWQADTVTSLSASDQRLSYTGSPLNCSTSLGSVDQTCQSATDKTFPAGAMLIPWEPGLWYVGSNGRGQKSLYRAEVHQPNTGSSSAALITQGIEKVPDVENLVIDYLTRDRSSAGALASGWVRASTLKGKWADPTFEVAAVRITLTLAAGDGVDRVKRSMQTVVALRNR